MSETLPPNWTAASLEELADRSRASLTIGPFGSNLKVADYREHGVPLVFVRDIRLQEFGGLGTRYVSTDKAIELASHTVGPGDLLVTKMGDPPGDTAVYPLHRPKAVITADCIRLKPDRQLTSSDFLKYALRAPATRQKVLAEAKGVAQQKVSLARFRPIQLGLPPLNEQRRIVEKVDALFAHSKKAKASLDRIPALLEKLKKSILAAAFRGDLTKDWREAHPDVEPADKLLDRIRTERRRRWEEAELAKMRAKGKEPKDDRWKQKYDRLPAIDTDGLPPLPGGWAWAPAEEIVEPGAEIVYGIVQPGAEVPGGVPYVRGKDIQNGEIRVSQLRRTSQKIAARYERAALAGGDVLLGIIRATKVAIVPDQLAGANITQGTARFRPANGIRTGWLAAWLESPECQAWLHSNYRGIDMPGLNLRDVRRTPVPIAPEAEQQALEQVLASVWSELSGVATAVERAHRRSMRLDQAILAKAFRGELVPQDPNDEPASVLLERIRAEREAAGPTKKKGGTGRGRKKKSTRAEPPPAEPEPPALTKPATPPPAQPDLPFEEQFLDLGPREQAQAVATALFGAGPLPKGDAVRLAAEGLRELGLSDHQRLRTGGKLHTALEKALTNGVRYGLLDRPARGEVRAIKPDAKSWTETDWGLVVAAVAPTGDLDAWVREAATWAAEYCGLDFTRLRTGGHIDRGLRTAAKRC